MKTRYLTYSLVQFALGTCCFLLSGSATFTADPITSTNCITAEEFKAEQPVVASRSDTVLPTPAQDLKGMVISYGKLTSDDQRKFNSALKRLTDGAQVKNFDFKGSLDVKRKVNERYVLDPIYHSAKKFWIFKFGQADSSLDTFRLCYLDEASGQASVLVNEPLRNELVTLSPSGRFVQYISGGGKDGPDPAYFSDKLRLSVFDIEKKRSTVVYVGDNFRNDLFWKGDKLIYCKIVESKSKSAPYTDLIYSYDAATGKNLNTHLLPLKTAEPHVIKAARHKLAMHLSAPPAVTWPKGKKIKFPSDNYMQESFWVDKTGVYFFVEIGVILTGTKQKEPDHQSYQLWKYDLTKKDLIMIMDLKLPMSQYAASFRIIKHIPAVAGQSKDRFLVTVFTAGKENSPINKPPYEAALPAHVYSLSEIDGDEVTQLWTDSDVGGMSVSVDGEPPVLHPY